MLAVLALGGLIHLLVALIILGLLYWVFTLIPLPPPLKQIGMIIFVIIGALILINFLLSLVGQPFFVV